MDSVEVIRKDTNGFSKQFCVECQRETWHYKDRTASVSVPHCTEHESKSLAHARKVLREYAEYTPVKVEPKPVEDTPEQIEKVKALEAKWKEGKEGNKNPNYFRKHKLNPAFAKAIFGDKQQESVGTVCSFCRKPTDYSVATQGKGPLQIMTLTEVTPNDEIIEKKIVKQTKVLACPECVGRLKPVVDKDGKIIQQAFTESSRV